MSGRGAPGPVVTPSGFFVLRTPLLPFAEVTAWGDVLQAPAAVDDPGVLGAALVDITCADADEYIAEFADSQVLVADVRPQLVPLGAPAARDGTRPRCQGGGAACHA
jgi:hypothetical protein